METIIMVQIATEKFKKRIEDKEDITNRIETTIHSIIEEWITEHLTENEDFEYDVLNELLDRESIRISDFTKLGNISIGVRTVAQTKLEDENV